MTHNVPNIRTGIITKIESCYKSLEVKKKRDYFQLHEKSKNRDGL